MNLRGKSVLLYGDSQMQGMGPTLKARLEEQGARVALVAQPGLPVRGALERLPPPSGYDLAIISLGGNNPPITYEAAATAMSHVLGGVAAGHVAWVTVLPSSDPTQEVDRARMRSFQEQYLPSVGVTTIDGQAVLRGLAKRDSVHLTAQSYITAAERVAGMVLDVSIVSQNVVALVAGCALIGAAAATYLHKNAR